MKKLLVISALAAGAFMSNGAMAAGIVDGSFETQGAASPGSFCYFGGVYAGVCGSGAWTGGGATSGLQNETNTDWPGIASPSGSYYAFIQSGYGDAGSISQLITLATGKYDFSWLAVGRGGSTNQTYKVSLGGGPLPINLYSGGPLAGAAFTAFSSGPVVVNAGTYRLTFAADSVGGDASAFIDAVSVAAVPETATWAMMIAGFGLLGAALRRRRQTGAMLTA